MLDRFRHAFFLKALRRVLENQKRWRKTSTVQSAQKLGLLFDAGNEAYCKEILELSRILEKRGKKTELFGFFSVKQAPEDTKFAHFTLKNCSWWTRVPSSDKSSAFTRENFDLLLCFNPNDLDPLHYVAASSNALMKMGYATNLPNDFDILLDTSKQKGPKHFIEQLEIYLDKIVLIKHEPAGAL